MFGLLKTIFGSGDVVKKGMDLIDNMYTSDEEEIVAKVNGKIALLKAYAPYKLTQRVLAFMFTIVFLACFALTLYMGITGQIANKDTVVDVLNQFYIGEIMLTITVFYFGGGFLEGAINARNERSNNGIIKQT